MQVILTFEKTRLKYPWQYVLLASLDQARTEDGAKLAASIASSRPAFFPIEHESWQTNFTVGRTSKLCDIIARGLRKARIAFLVHFACEVLAPLCTLLSGLLQWSFAF